MLQISVPSLSFCFVLHTFSCNLLFNFLLQKNQTYKRVERRVSHGLITKLHLYPKLFWSKSQTSYHFIHMCFNKVEVKSLSRAFNKVEVKSLSRARLFATPWIVACTKLLRPWDFQGKSTGVGCHFLLQGLFPTQGSNPGLSHCRQTLYHLSHQESPVFQYVSLNTGKSFLLSFIYFWLY